MASSKQDKNVAADDGLTRTGRLCGGLINDLKRRLPHYASDWRDGLHPKVAGATLFLYFACLANAVAFGGLTGIVTGGEIGTLEMIVATAVGGISFALLSGQPLTILGGTGPIVIFTGLLYLGCEQLGLPFLPVYGWVGLWSGLFMFLLAITDASFLMRYFTRFTDEIFATLIAVIFIVEACKSVIAALTSDGVSSATGLLTLILAVGTYQIARALKGVLRTPYLRRRLREFLSDFGPSLAIALMTGFALLLPDVELESAAIPETFATTTGRPWTINLFAVPVWVWIASAGPALLATILLFLDQNITTRLVNARSHRLKKGPGFHLDLAVVGVITAGCSLFGLPWIVAATVHSLNHVKSLADTEVIDIGGDTRERIVSVRENRVSPLLIHVLIACSILILPLIKLIPMAVLFGLFLYMGFATLAGNDFIDRLLLWVTDRQLYPKTHYVRMVPPSTIHKFTGIQLMGLGALWVVKTSAVGILFPVLIALLVPLRLSLGRFFPAEHLDALDGDEPAHEVAEDHMMAGDVHA
jgi:hypothetical protein